MAYDESKEQLLFEEVHDGGLMLKVVSYNGGFPKVQIGPRVITKRDGTDSFIRAGRLTKEEFAWVVEHSEKMLDSMD